MLDSCFGHWSETCQGALSRCQKLHQFDPQKLTPKQLGCCLKPDGRSAPKQVKYLRLLIQQTRGWQYLLKSKYFHLYYIYTLVLAVTFHQDTSSLNIQMVVVQFSVAYIITLCIDVAFFGYTTLDSTVSRCLTIVWKSSSRL